MADQSSFGMMQQPTLSERVLSFYSELDTVIRDFDITQWVSKLSENFEPLDLDLVREDQKDRRHPVSIPLTHNTSNEAPTEHHPTHAKRAKLLAQMVIKVLDSGKTDKFSPSKRIYAAWERNLTVFNTIDCRGTPLTKEQLALITKACAAVFQHPSPLPNDAYELIADYLIAKQEQDQARVVELLARPEI